MIHIHIFHSMYGKLYAQLCELECVKYDKGSGYSA